MDIDLEKRVNQAIEELKLLSPEQFEFNDMDPIARMLFISMLNEVQKVQDHVDEVSQRIVEKYCSDFIPNYKVGAIPSIAILAPKLKQKKDATPIRIGSGAVFSYKAEGVKHQLNYVPLFSTSVVPHDDLFVLSHSILTHQDQLIPISMNATNKMWVGIASPVELESLTGLSLLINGTHGVAPKRILVGENVDLEFATMTEMENVEMAEPFDAQQSSVQFFSCIEAWKERLLNMENAILIHITDKLNDRDVFKPRPFPNSFKQELEDNVLNCFAPNIVWLQLEFRMVLPSLMIVS